MAYLNVRDRRLETKIAYLGPLHSGRTTNFDQLGGGEVGGDILALFWKPKAETMFRDCGVRVQLVTARGEPTDAQVVDLLRDADGVVFVADADPAAQDRNRDCLAGVRAALSLHSGRAVPVVVQLNKTDLPDAVSPETLARSLQLGEWPCVSASAARGEGVVETLERALDDVLETLCADPKDMNENSEEEAETSRASARRTPREGNPLLSALRQVLRETVVAEVDELEGRLVARLEGLFAQLSAAQLSAAQLSAARVSVEPSDREPSEHLTLLRQLLDESSKMLDESGKVRGALDAIREQVEASDVSAGAASERQSSAAQTLGTELSSQRSELTAVRERITKALAKQEQQLTAATEVLGVVELAMHASSAEVTRALESVASDVKVADARASVAAMKVAVESLSARTTMLAAAVKPVETIVPRLDVLEGLIRKEIREGLRSVTSRLVAAQEEAASTHAVADARTAELQVLLQEVLEELKRPKKSWFA
jgi:hypothetical protein